MGTREARRHSRAKQTGFIRVGWEGPVGSQYAFAKVMDVSDSGLCIELEVAIPAQSTIVVQSEALPISGSGTVKYCKRVARGYLVGMEFNCMADRRAFAAKPAYL